VARCCLDEISGDAAGPAGQAVASALQEQGVRTGGWHVADWRDVRIKAATTNRDLAAEADHQGTFRQDLYYRLSTIPVLIPPLRERV
jgi:transcriptional regulator with GAF, ATPase, and Fis domain